jgi:hypothetical protein
VPAAALLGLAGCTAILGDFSDSVQAPDGGSSGDAATVPDSTTTEASAGDATPDAPSTSGDGQAEAGDATPEAAPPGPLRCKTWALATPLQLEVLSTGARSVTGPLTVVPLQSGKVRIFAGKGPGVPFSMYTVDLGQIPPSLLQVDAPSVPNGQLSAVHRSPSAIAPYTALAIYTKPLQTTGSYYAYVVPDLMPGNGPLPADFQIYQETIQLPTVSSIRALPFSTTDLFTAVAYPTQTAPTDYVLGVGRATSTAPATLTTAATTPNAGDLHDLVLFHGNGNVYVYAENDNSAPGLSAWTVPDTASFSTPPPKRAISGGQPAFLHDIAENTSSAAANVSYQVQLTTGVNGSIGYRAGTVDYAKLDTWVAGDLPLTKTYTDLTRAPVYPNGTGAASRWSGDNLMLLGPGLLGSDGGSPPGLNLLWFDATGALRAEEDGADALLADRDDFTAATASAIAVTPTSARWAVAWIETQTDDAGSYDTIYYDELDCQ